MDGAMPLSNRMEMEVKMGGVNFTDALTITPEILSLIAEIDEFKGSWAALGRISPDRLMTLRRIATIESIGSSTRIEGARLSDAEVERLLANLEVQTFASRDEEEVAGYAEVTGNRLRALEGHCAHGKPHQTATPRPAQTLFKG